MTKKMFQVLTQICGLVILVFGLIATIGLYIQASDGLILKEYFFGPLGLLILVWIVIDTIGLVRAIFLDDSK